MEDKIGNIISRVRDLVELDGTNSSSLSIVKGMKVFSQISINNYIYQIKLTRTTLKLSYIEKNC